MRTLPFFGTFSWPVPSRLWRTPTSSTLSVIVLKREQLAGTHADVCGNEDHRPEGGAVVAVDLERHVGQSCDLRLGERHQVPATAGLLESGGQARQRLAEAISQLERALPKLAALLEDAEEDVLAFYAFPAEHWRKLRSTNPLERFNREIGRRTDVVGIFPDDQALIRLTSMLAIEANDEWLVGRAYVSQQSIGPLLEERADRSSEEALELQAA